MQSLILLLCPLSMGLMMWFMMKRQNGASPTPALGGEKPVDERSREHVMAEAAGRSENAVRPSS